MRARAARWLLHDIAIGGSRGDIRGQKNGSSGVLERFHHGVASLAAIASTEFTGIKLALATRFRYTQNETALVGELQSIEAVRGLDLSVSHGFGISEGLQPLAPGKPM